AGRRAAKPTSQPHQPRSVARGAPLAFSPRQPLRRFGGARCGAPAAAGGSGQASPASAVHGFVATLRQNLDDEDSYDKRCKICTADVLCSLTQKRCPLQSSIGGQVVSRDATV
ncbi:unnamed protein product, partial [Urochloa humidicola]